jgi:hypothetical protein
MTKIFSQKIAIIAILLISFFGMNLEEGKGQDPCDVGYTYGTTTITINGCDYLIKVCYICSPIGEYDIEMKFLGYVKPVGCVPSPPISDADLYIQLKAKAKEYVLEICGITPCDTHEDYQTKMLFIEYICWEMTQDSYGNLHINSCNLNQTCEVIYRVCRNLSTNTISWTPIVSTYIGPNTLCPKLSLPPTNNVFPINGCYMLDNSCFP